MYLGIRIFPRTAKNGSYLNNLLYLQSLKKLLFLHVDVKERTRVPTIWRVGRTLFLDPAGCFRWWAWLDSNQRPRAYQARALTN